MLANKKLEHERGMEHSAAGSKCDSGRLGVRDTKCAIL